MATSQALTACPVAFAKYPELPHDVRLMIIDEAIQVTVKEYRKVNRSWKTAKPFIFPLASVNYEWNRVIEMKLFNHICITPSRLSEFAEICGKRHGRLDNIMLSISMREVPGGDRPETYVGAAIAQLFNIMKDWSHLDRERQGLLNVRLFIEDNLGHVPRGPRLTCNFGTLPQVPMIGAFSEEGFRFMLHPSSSLRIYQNCPNIRCVTLGLPFLGQQSQSTQEARNAITSLASIQPDLTHLELRAQQGHPSRLTLERDAWMPAPDCVAAFSPSWINNLQQLELQNVDDIPRFLTQAGQLAWPNLKVLSLRGVVDTQNKVEVEIKVISRETCTALVQGLIAMLPSMPHITTVLIGMQNTMGRSETIIRLGMSLGSPCKLQEDFWVESCSYRFVRNTDNGVVLAIGTNFPGQLATELQHTVRRHQLKDLGVFFHYKYYGLRTWGNRFCWQWDPDSGSWDAAFEDEEDEFIYQMGQYLDYCPM